MEIRHCSRLGEGKGVYATKMFFPGDIVHLLFGSILNYPTRESIHIGKNKHIIDKLGSFINHSNQPNIKIDGLAVVAIKTININDEIMFDYNSSEINMAEPFYSDGVFICGKNS